MFFFYKGALANRGYRDTRCVDIASADGIMANPIESYLTSPCLMSALLCDVSDVVYTIDDGNRGHYSADDLISTTNLQRFECFVKCIADAVPAITVWYIGGSWTKRQYGNDNGVMVVDDASPNKTDSALVVPYERAKCEAEEASRRSATRYGVRIHFVDYISVVPNLSPQFSIAV